MCVSCLIWDGNFNPTGAMQELLMLPHCCVELGASWCPGLRAVSIVAQAILWKSCRCRGQLLSWSRVFLPGPSLWGRGSVHKCEVVRACVFSLTQKNDLESVGLCFIGNVVWGLLKPILKHPKLLSSALIWRNNNFSNEKWQCSCFFATGRPDLAAPRCHTKTAQFSELCCCTHTLC